MAKAGLRKVGVVVTTELACYRDMIRGINAFAAVEATWQVELFGTHEDLPSLARDRGLNGLILGPIHDVGLVRRAADAVGGCAVGVGAQFEFHGLPGLVETESDDVAVGRLAADHLRAKGFQHFAFIGTEEAEWSDLRGKGFQKAVEEHGFHVSILRPEAKVASDDRGWRMPHFGRDTLNWLLGLPRPLGLFVCNDLRARALVDLCHNEGIRIPDEIAVLGVDNDDLICDLAQPQLSSIAIPWKKIGFQAAGSLEKLLRGNTVKPRRILVGPECVMERQSTDTLAITDVDVAAAMRFIRSHAHEAINVEDILRHLPVARRSLEKRFRSIIGRSPLEEIRKAHTDRAKYLLAETELSMPEVAEKSGYSSAAWFSKAFRDMTGETPTAYRKRFKTQ